MKLKNQLEEAIKMLDSHEEQLEEMKNTLMESDAKLRDTEKRLSSTQKDNEILKTQSNKAKEEALLQKKQREDDLLKARELEQEKKRAEREALNRDLEAKLAKREVDKLHEDKETLLEGHSQLAKELEALKEHNSVLENQNISVFLLGDEQSEAN